MNLVMRIFWRWLPFAILTAGVCGLVYLAVQQSLRLGGNDPQIQMAQDTASALSAGGDIAALLPSQKVDLANSLAPFIMVFDETGKSLASNAVLHGSDPAVPSGVFDYARQNGENRVTWQPESEVRIAAVVVPFKTGFVLAGRSLLETEKREDLAQLQSGAAMLVIWVATLIAVALGEIFSTKRTA